MSEVQDTQPVAPDAASAPAAPAPAPAPVDPIPAAPVPDAPAATPDTAPAPAESDDTDPIDDLYGQNEQASTPVEPDVPETYDFNGIELPDGTSVDDGASLVSDLGHELKLSNDQARTLLEKGLPKVHASIQAQRDKLVTMWTNQIKSDPVLGGEHYKETSANLSRVMNKYGSKEAYAVLNQSGLGSNPAIVRMMNAIGKDLGEENKFVNSSVTAQNDKAARLRAFYNNSNLNFGD